MEGYAVAEVCRERHIPCRLIKGVTDEADENARAAIREHLDSVSEAVAGHAMQALGAGTDASVPLGRKLLRFTRAEHTVFSLPLLFAGAWLGAGGRFPAWRALALLALVGLGARTFGMALTRIIDRRAPPNTACPIEIEKTRSLETAPMLMNEMRIEQHSLRLGEDRCRPIQMAPAGLDHAHARIREFQHQTLKKQRLRHKVGVKDGHQGRGIVA